MTSSTTKTQMIRSYLSRNYGKTNKRLVNREKFLAWAEDESIAENTALGRLYSEGYHLVVAHAQFVSRIEVGFTTAQSKALDVMSTRSGVSRPQIIREAVSTSLGL